MTSEPFDLGRYRERPMLLLSAALLLERLGRDSLERGGPLELGRYLVTAGAACAMCAHGVEPSDKTLRADLGETRDSDLIECTMLLEVARDLDEFADAADLLQLFACPIDD